MPILNKMEDQVLALEDYTLNREQIKCLSQCIQNFSSNAFRKVYLNNNGLKDIEIAEFLEGLVQNKNINAIEIAYNRVEDHGIRALCKFIEKK